MSAEKEGACRDIGGDAQRVLRMRDWRGAQRTEERQTANDQRFPQSIHSIFLLKAKL
jgi:hypothetical protein